MSFLWVPPAVPRSLRGRPSQVKGAFGVATRWRTRHPGPPARAPGHDSYWKFHREAFLPLVPHPGRLTVDLGCGEGRVGRDLAARGHRVVGLDASPAMAHAAAGHPEAAGRVVVGDAARLPLAAGIADCVIAHMSLQDVDDMEGAVREIARVLEPGGRLVLAIVHPVNSAGGFIGERSDPNRPFVISGSWYTPSLRGQGRTGRADHDLPQQPPGSAGLHRRAGRCRIPDRAPPRAHRP